MAQFKSENQPCIIFLSGASGAGKTTMLKYIEKSLGNAAACFYFDSIGVPSSEEMVRLYGSGSGWQKAMTEQWVEKLLARDSANEKKLVFLEGQVNLDFIEGAFRKYSFDNYKIILIHCDQPVRHNRLLHNRKQPELITSDMDNWAAFLERQALAKNVPILNTSTGTIEDMLTQILSYTKIENECASTVKG